MRLANTRLWWLSVISLAVIVLFYAANSIIIGRQLTNYATDEYSAVVADSLRSYCNGMASPVSEWKFIRYDVYPPIYLLTASAVTMIVGKHWAMVVLVTNTLYLVALLLGSYFLGKEIKDRATGVMTALVVSVYPLTFGAFRTLCMEFAAMGIVAFAMVMLVRSDYFGSIKYSVLSAVFCGIGIMIKDSFGAFIAGPLLYVSFICIKKIVKADRSRLMNIILFAVITGLIMYPYYARIDTLKLILNRPFTEITGLGWYQWENLRLFTAGLFESQLSVPFFILFVASLVFLRRYDTKWKIILLLWVIIPNIILIMMPHWKSPRYLLMQLPVLAVISALGLRQVVKTTAGKIGVGLLISMGLLQNLNFVYGLGGIPLSTGEWENRQKLAYFRRNYEINQSLKEMRRHSVILEVLKEKMSSKLNIRKGTNSQKERYSLIVPINDSPFGIVAHLESFFWFNEMPFEQKTLGWINKKEFEDVFEKIENTDFILYSIPVSPDKYLWKRTMPLPYDAIHNERKKWYDLSGMNGYNIGDKERAKFAEIWNSHVATYRSSERIYDDKDTNVFLLSRE